MIAAMAGVEVVIERDNFPLNKRPYFLYLS